MELVPDAFFHPGACFHCETSQGPFVATGKRDQLEAYVYVCQACAAELAHAAGLPTAVAVEALHEQLDAAERERARYEEIALELAGNLAEADNIRLALAYSMERGFVVDPKHLTVRPRLVKGTPAIDWAKSILPVLQEDDAA